MTARKPSPSVLELLSGPYEVDARDADRGYILLKFWLVKFAVNAEIPMGGMRFQARFSNRVLDLVPERLDVFGNRLGMRLKCDALPETWLGECEIVISIKKSYRCFPFKGDVDISSALLPDRMSRPSVEPLQEEAPP